MRRRLLFLLIALLIGCSPAATPTPQRIYRVHASDATQPWLPDLYKCADQSGALLAVDNIDSSDVVLRLGEPDALPLPAYKIDTEDILVVTHPQAGVGSLTQEEVQAIYTGQYSNWKELNGNDVPIVVWKYPEGEDIQQIFDQAIMDGLRTVPAARLAASAQSMSDSVGTNPGSIGILPRHWKTGNTHETFLAAIVPMLAIVKDTPDDVLGQIIACFQK